LYIKILPAHTLLHPLLYRPRWWSRSRSSSTIWNWKDSRYLHLANTRVSHINMYTWMTNVTANGASHSLPIHFQCMTSNHTLKKYNAFTYSSQHSHPLARHVVFNNSGLF